MCPTESTVLPSSDGHHIKRAAVMQMAVGVIQSGPLVKGDLPDTNQEKSIRGWITRVRC